ncbi:MerR family transcriptional regulator [Streptomyces lincolnensis]|uniref:MerR family transcriptional regulator n=1 Tax=Streptomyces lincolnensis TaxID=1915 RepID=A0A1B1MHM0_STRLN|nr:MerR family transcriptional regulator [Streptomyces lincolnensis]ANS68110.1 MerR family transcriptional regulator [Streptomyces lincolnensis]AXG53684.1 MerR family transcriptional regulator [Streptomyces lincolnensis]QMV09757.1 MerR family transcriptional regulator [Streptomyces lincolnensis]
MIEDGTGLFTIGELARATGLTVRTIRYWSDEGVLHPVTRSAGGYRLYDAEAAARLELIRTLRELGLGLDVVRKVLDGERTVAEVAAAHVAALDAQIRSLKVTRAVLSSVARRGSTAKEMTLTNKLARLSAAERQRIMEEFVEEALAGLDTVDPDIRERMRRTAVDLADDPTPEQVDAWMELAGMLQDPVFRRQMRRAVEFNAADRVPDAPRGQSVWFAKRLVELVAPLRERGVEPGAPEAEQALRDLFGDADRTAVLERMTAGFNERVARYRELLSVVNRQPAPPHAEDFAWVVAALRARTAG